MRKLSMIAALPLLALTACGGASGPETVGSVAPPTGGTSGSGGTGGGVSTGGTGTGGTVTPTPTPAHFLDISAETSFEALGAFQTLSVTETGIANRTGPVLYQGNASTVRTPSGTVTYSPRDGIFTINFVDTKAGMNRANTRFQDPGHRRDSITWGVPDLNNFNYIQVLGPSQRPVTTTDAGREDRITFFYQRPGSETKYVSLAGYVRNAYDATFPDPADPNGPVVFKGQTTSLFERGAMVFGQQTVRSQIPTVGTASYAGGMLATMIVNDAAYGGNPNYFQWITGTSTLNFDFSRQTMNILLTGTASAADYGGMIVNRGVPAGSTFRAEGSGTISLVTSGGFTGRFSSVAFTGASGTTTPAFQSVNPDNSTAGGNSIDGTFYGPDAVNVGGNFRIVGGVPNQRVDILGAFTGAKK